MRLHALLFYIMEVVLCSNPVKFQIDPNYVYLSNSFENINAKEMKIYKTL